MSAIIVTELVKTCNACPAQWDGKTSDGGDLYIRYRWGYLRVDLNGETIWGAPVGEDQWDGTLNEEQLAEHTRGLLELPQATP